MADTAPTPIIVVSFPGVRGKQRWVALVPIADMVAEVRKRIPPDAIVNCWTGTYHRSKRQS
jgi:hypothetical protein